MEGFRSSLWLTFSLLVSNQLCSAAAAGNIWDSTNLATGRSLEAARGLYKRSLATPFRVFAAGPAAQHTQQDPPPGATPSAPPVLRADPEDPAADAAFPAGSLESLGSPPPSDSGSSGTSPPPPDSATESPSPPPPPDTPDSPPSPADTQDSTSPSESPDAAAPTQSPPDSGSTPPTNPPSDPSPPAETPPAQPPLTPAGPAAAPPTDTAPSNPPASSGPSAGPTPVLPTPPSGTPTPPPDSVNPPADSPAIPMPTLPGPSPDDTNVPDGSSPAPVPWLPPTVPGPDASAPTPPPGTSPLVPPPSDSGSGPVPGPTPLPTLPPTPAQTPGSPSSEGPAPAPGTPAATTPPSPPVDPVVPSPPGGQPSNPTPPSPPLDPVVPSSPGGGQPSNPTGPSTPGSSGDSGSPCPPGLPCRPDTPGSSSGGSSGGSSWDSDGSIIPGDFEPSTRGSTISTDSDADSIIGPYGDKGAASSGGRSGRPDAYGYDPADGFGRPASAQVVGPAGTLEALNGLAGNGSGYDSSADLETLLSLFDLECAVAAYFSCAADTRALSSSLPLAASATCQPTSLSSDMRPLALGIAAEKLEQAAVLQLAIKEAGGGDVSCPDIDVGAAVADAYLASLQKTGSNGVEAGLNPYQGDLLFLQGAFIATELDVAAHNAALISMMSPVDKVMATNSAIASAYQAGSIRALIYLHARDMVSLSKLGITISVRDFNSAVADYLNASTAAETAGGLVQPVLGQTGPHLTNLNSAGTLPMVSAAGAMDLLTTGTKTSQSSNSFP